MTANQNSNAFCRRVFSLSSLAAKRTSNPLLSITDFTTIDWNEYLDKFIFQGTLGKTGEQVSAEIPNAWQTPPNAKLAENIEQYMNFSGVLEGMQELIAHYVNGKLAASSQAAEKSTAAKEKESQQKKQKNSGKKPMKNLEMAVKCREIGNAAFKRKHFALALEMYTGAICNAPPDEVVNFEVDKVKGSNLALAYANRSAAFFHVGLYDAALVDIEAALAAGYRDTEGKLNERKRKAKAAQKKAENEFADHLARQKRLLSALASERGDKEIISLKREHLLSAYPPPPAAPIESSSLAETTASALKTALHFQPSPVCPTLSAKVEVKSTGDQHYLVAREPIPLGAVLAIEQPFCSVLGQRKEMKYCHHCCRRLLNNCAEQMEGAEKPLYILPVVPCPSCAEVLFCSKACQREATSSYHQFECALLPLLHTLEPSHHVALRMLLTSGSSFATVAKTVAEAEMAKETAATASSVTAKPKLSPVSPTCTISAAGSSRSSSSTFAEQQQKLAAYSAVLQMKPLQQSWNFPSDNIFCSITAGLLVELATRSGWLPQLTAKKSEHIPIPSLSLLLSVSDESPELDDHQLAGALFRRHLLQMPFHIRTVFALSSAAVEEGKTAQASEKDIWGLFPPESARYNLFDQECLPFMRAPVASAIYPVTSSSIRHSCASNAIATFHYGNLLVVRASRAIGAGEEVTLTTNNEVHYSRLELAERQKVLKEHYAIERCACTACQYELANGLDGTGRYLPLAHSDTCRGLVAARSSSSSTSNNNNNTDPHQKQYFYCTACDAAVPEKTVREKYELFDRICQKMDANDGSLNYLVNRQTDEYLRKLRQLTVEDCSVRRNNFATPPTHPEMANYGQLSEMLQALLLVPPSSEASAPPVANFRLLFACRAQIKLATAYRNLAHGYASFPNAEPATKYAERFMAILEAAFGRYDEVAPTATPIADLTAYGVEPLPNLLQLTQLLDAGSRMFSLAALARKELTGVRRAPMAEEDQAATRRWMARLERHQKLLSIFSLNELTVDQSPVEGGSTSGGTEGDRFGRQPLPADDGSGFLAFQRCHILSLKMGLLMAKKAV